MFSKLRVVLRRARGRRSEATRMRCWLCVRGCSAVPCAAAHNKPDTLVFTSSLLSSGWNHLLFLLVRLYFSKCLCSTSALKVSALEGEFPSWSTSPRCDSAGRMWWLGFGRHGFCSQPYHRQDVLSARVSKQRGGAVQLRRKHTLRGCLTSLEVR